MSYIDIIIIAIIALGALVGLWKGTVKTLISLVCFAVAALVCFFISDYCLKFLLGVDVIKQFALGEGMSLRSLIGSAIDLDATGVVKALYEPLIARYADIGGAAAWGATTEEFLSVAISLHMFTVLITVILYFAARIIASIVGFVLRIIFVHGGTGLISRIAGMVIGAVKGTAVAMLLLFVVSFIFPLGFSKPVTDAMDQSKITSAICNVEYKFLSDHLYSDETLEMMMNGAGFVKTQPDIITNL